MNQMNNGQADETGDTLMVASDTPVAESRPSTTYPKLDMFGTAKRLLLGVYHAASEGEPIRGVQLHIDDMAVLDTLVEIAYITRDAVTDILGISTNGRLFVGIKPEGVLDLPVEVAEITGNIEESELAARYCESKIAAIDKHISMGNAPQAMMQVTWEESYQHCALTLRAMAREFRMGLHLPVKHIEGRVIPYNESNDTGIKHEGALRQFFTDVHERNVKAGWWTDIQNGEPKKRNLGELLILFVTEMAEAYEAWEQQCRDDKLPEHPGFGVEMGDLAIRFADLAGAALAGRLLLPSGEPHQNPGERMFREVCEIAWRYEAIRKTPEACGEPETADHMPPMDIAVMIDHKLDFNAHRPDHKIENRLKEDGKRT